MKDHKEQFVGSRLTVRSQAPSGVREKSVVDLIRSRVGVLGLVVAPVVTVGLAMPGCNLVAFGTCEQDCSGVDAGGNVVTDGSIDADAKFPVDASDAKPDVEYKDAGAGGTGGDVGAGGAGGFGGGDAGLGAAGGFDGGDAGAVDAGAIDAGDPCADAVLNGFTVTVKGLPNNRYDFVNYRAGVPINDSLANGVDETTDNVIAGVKYGDVLVVQSKPDVADAPEAAKYATGNVVAVPAGCIDQNTKQRPILAYTTLSAANFQWMHDTCPACTPIASTGVKPTFHYECKKVVGSFNQSELYHITFKKP